MMSTNHLDLLKSNPQATLVQYLTHVAIITWTCLPALRRYLLQPFLFFLHSDLSSCISSSFSFFILRFSSRCLFEQKYCVQSVLGQFPLCSAVQNRSFCVEDDAVDMTFK